MRTTVRPRRLALESLEPRTLLSGNVTAVVPGGSLLDDRLTEVDWEAVR